MMMTLFDDEQILKAYTKDIDDNITYREAKRTAERLIKKGQMSLQDIADCVPSLSFEELKELEAEIMQLAQKMLLGSVKQFVFLVKNDSFPVRIKI